MTLPTFEVLRPKTLAEALRWLAAQPDAFPIAGGTNLIPDARAGKLDPNTVIDISTLAELRGIRVKDDQVRIGACTTIAELLSSKEIAAQAPVLHASAKTFANTLIRNRATIGGNLVNNAPCADTAPALLVLDAEVELSSEGGKRWLRLADFLQAPFSVDKEDQEMLTAVRFGVPPANRIGRFRKMGLRKISCMAKVDVAMLLTFDDAHKCSDARLSLGAACPTALRAAEAETALTGKELSPDCIRTVAEAAARAAVPREGSEYKQQVVAGLVRQLLQEIAEEVGGTDG